MKLDPERPGNIQIIQKEILIQILNKESLIDKLKKRKENSHFSKRVSISASSSFASFVASQHKRVEISVTSSLNSLVPVLTSLKIASLCVINGWLRTISFIILSP